MATTLQSQNSNKPLRQPNALALSESSESKAKLDMMLLGCVTVQKLYGRDPGSLEAVNEVFHNVLSRFPAEKVLRAFQVWIERSPEFPTPADIVGLVKRNGRPPLSEAQFIAISKKDGEDRTDAEWKYLREYQAERDSGWDEYPDAEVGESHRAENNRLRKEILGLRLEVKRLGNLLHEERKRNGAEKPKPDQQQKIDATIAAMRSAGAPETDVEAFLKSECATVAEPINPKKEPGHV